MKLELVDHALDAKTRHAVAADLQRALVDLVAMGLCAKQAHWVVVGPRFRSVHLALDELVAHVRAAADDVAERSVALGRVPDGTPEKVARDTDGFMLPDGFLEDDVVLSTISRQLIGVAARMRDRIARVNELDVVSGDLLTGITRELEKHAWMLQAALHRTATIVQRRDTASRVHA